jgi:hypothetical protein
VASLSLSFYFEKMAKRNYLLKRVCEDVKLFWHTVSAQQMCVERINEQVNNISLASLM